MKKLGRRRYNIPGQYERRRNEEFYKKELSQGEDNSINDFYMKKEGGDRSKFYMNGMDEEGEMSKMRMVEVPRFYIAMAFNGQHDRISIPRSRIKTPSSSRRDNTVLVMLPRRFVDGWERVDYDDDGEDEGVPFDDNSETITIPKHVVVAGVKRANHMAALAKDKAYSIAKETTPLLLSPLSILVFARTTVEYIIGKLFGFLLPKPRYSYGPPPASSGPIYGSSSELKAGNYKPTLWRPDKGSMISPYPNREYEENILLRPIHRRRDKHRKYSAISRNDVVSEDRNEPPSWNNYWQKLPKFITNEKKKTLYWRHSNVSSNRRIGQVGKEWIPGRPDPVVWGNLAKKMREEIQEKVDLENWEEHSKFNVTSRAE